jgi:hypothetical protein
MSNKKSSSIVRGGYLNCIAAACRGQCSSINWSRLATFADWRYVQSFRKHFKSSNSNNTTTSKSKLRPQRIGQCLIRVELSSVAQWLKQWSWNRFNLEWFSMFYYLDCGTTVQSKSSSKRNFWSVNCRFNTNTAGAIWRWYRYVNQRR